MQTAIPSATQSTTGPHPHAGRPFTLAAPMGDAHGHSKPASTVSQTANKKADTAMHNRGIGAKPRTLALARTRRGAVWPSKGRVGEVFICQILFRALIQPEKNHQATTQRPIQQHRVKFYGRNLARCPCVRPQFARLVQGPSRAAAPNQRGLFLGSNPENI